MGEEGAGPWQLSERSVTSVARPHGNLCLPVLGITSELATKAQHTKFSAQLVNSRIQLEGASHLHLPLS